MILGTGNFLAMPLWLHAQNSLRDKGPIPRAALGTQDCLALLGYKESELRQLLHTVRLIWTFR